MQATNEEDGVQGCCPGWWLRQQAGRVTVKKEESLGPRVRHRVGRRHWEKP